MSTENALMNSTDEDNESSFDFDELEAKLEDQLQSELSELDILEEEKEKIGCPDALGNTIKNVVWEQFVNQIGTVAGEDFIKENRGMTLDLRNEAHIQTTENFANGKIASHNTEIDYQKRYDDWQSNFVKDENGNVVTHTNRTGSNEPTLVKGARKPFDDGRPTGSTVNHTDMDHTVPAAEIIRDPSANAHLTKEEQIAFANSDANLNEIDSSLNRSKGDKSMTDWLDSPNANGQKPDEIFDISDEQDKSLRQKDAEAREEYEKLKAEGEKKSVEAGKKSQKAEAKRIGGKAVRAVVMRLLADFVREIIGKLVKWFKTTGKNIKTLLESLKEAIKSFVGKLKTHLFNAADTLLTTIATAIIGPVVGMIKKVWMLLKQGWQSLKEAIAYLKSPKRKGQPIGRTLLEVGKIVMTGLTAAGAIVLGEAIEKGLMTFPVLAVEIPLIGSLANILGIFLGAVVSGIIGAIAINLIQKAIEKQKKSELGVEQVKKGNEILVTQGELLNVKAQKSSQIMNEALSSMSERHAQAREIIRDTAESILCKSDENNNDEEFDAMNAALNGLTD